MHNIITPNCHNWPRHWVKYAQEIISDFGYKECIHCHIIYGLSFEIMTSRNFQDFYWPDLNTSIHCEERLWIQGWDRSCPGFLHSLADIVDTPIQSTICVICLYVLKHALHVWDFALKTDIRIVINWSLVCYHNTISKNKARKPFWPLCICWRDKRMNGLFLIISHISQHIAQCSRWEHILCILWLIAIYCFLCVTSP